MGGRRVGIGVGRREAGRGAASVAAADVAPWVSPQPEAGGATSDWEVAAMDCVRMKLEGSVQVAVQ